jgi:hypothetical protein
MIVLSIAGCGFSARLGSPDAGSIDAIDAAPEGWLAGVTHRKPIAITAPTPTTLGEFPVAIQIAADAGLAAHARADAADLAFTTADGVTLLPFERVVYNPAIGRLEVWVKLPSLPGSATTTIFVNYGGEPRPPLAAPVWSSVFAGVWHMTGSVGTADSTANAHGLAPIGAGDIPAAVVGEAGAARGFDGVDDVLDLPDPVDGSLDFANTSFSYAAWVFETGALDQYDTAFYKGGTSASEPGYCMLLGTGSWAAKLHDGSNYVDVEFGQRSALAGRWVHLAVVIDRAAAATTTFTNGVLANQVALSLGSVATGERLQLGRSETMPFRGSLDEVRIYTGALSADWIATEYANLASTSFLAIGAEQRR